MNTLTPSNIEPFEFSDLGYTKGQPSLTVAQFLKRQDLLVHRMQTIAEKGFIADALLQGGYPAEGGVVPYTRNESIYPDRDPEIIPEGGTYPVTGDTLPTPLVEPVVKYGLLTFITEEAVRRSIFPVVDRELRKLANGMIKYLDTTFLNRLTNQSVSGIQTRAAAATWTSSATTIQQDIENCRADIRNLYQGYEPDTLVIHPSKLVALMTNTTFASAYAGSAAPNNPLFTGQLAPLFGLDIMVTPNLSPTTIALVMQRKMVGGIADEVPMQTKALPFDENNDSYWLKIRRITATFFTDPQACVKLTGI